MKKLSLIALGLFMVLMVNSAFAVRVTALYQAAVPVATQSADTLKENMQNGLIQVLVKVSGNPNVAENPKIKSRLDSANKLIQEYSYTAQVGDAAKPYLLHMDFDPTGVNQILREANVPIWSQTRPLLLVWMDYEIPQHAPEIIGNDSATGLTTLLKQSTDRRGVPVLFPVLDMTDMNQVTVNDVASIALPKITEASKRYSSNGVLVGKIVQDNANFNTQWKLQVGNQQWSWNINAKTMPEVFDILANNVANTLAGNYAVVVTNNTQSNVNLRIEGVSQADDFTRLMDYMQHLASVSDVRVEHVEGSVVELSVDLRGNAQSFTQALALSKKLTPIATDADSNTLTYQWNH